MHQQNRIQGIADALVEARRQGRSWRPASWEGLSVDDAYAVQDQVGERLGWFSGSRPAAWKAGAPNRSATPTAAPLPKVLDSGRAWSCQGQGGVAIEAELAFRFGRSPSSAEDIPDCIATMCVSIEIVATRLDGGYQAPAEWKLADHQLHAGLVVGREVDFSMLDWGRQKVGVEINGVASAGGEGGHPCGDPLWPLPWLIQHASARGHGARSGDLVTTGSWVGIIPVQPGDEVVAHFPGIGSATVRFVP
jgi:2-keto-4-pentenoate hydratase